MLVKLTERSVQTLPPRGASIEYRDDHRDGGVRGLCLRVLADSSGEVSRRSYSVVWNVSGKTKRQTIGEASTMTLAQARAEARRIRSSVTLGTFNPVARARDGMTMSGLIAAYLESPESSEWRPATRDRNVRMLRNVIAAMGDTPAAAITRGDLQTLIDNVRRDRPGLAIAIASTVRSMFRWAISREIMTTDPTASIVRPRSRSRERVMSPEEIGRFWRACEDDQENSVTAFGMQLILCTGARPGEIFGIKAEEITTETDGRWWILPAERSKTGTAIRRPLSAEADRLLRILEEANGRRLDGSLILRGSRMRATWSKAFRKLAARTGIEGCTPHDLRRTARTTLARLGVRHEVGEAILGHAIGGVVGTYQRYAWEPEMRAALESLSAEIKRLAEESAASDQQS